MNTDTGTRVCILSTYIRTFTTTKHTQEYVRMYILCNCGAGVRQNINVFDLSEILQTEFTYSARQD